MKKRLYKSNKSKVICGVCGGWAEMLNWDPVIIRSIFIILSFFKGIGIILYLILAIITPLSLDFNLVQENDVENKSETKNSSSHKVKSKNESGEGCHTDRDFNAFFESKKR